MSSNFRTLRIKMLSITISDENLEKENDVTHAIAGACQILNNYSPIMGSESNFIVGEILFCLNRFLSGYLKSGLEDKSKLLNIQIIPYLIKYSKAMKHDPEQKIIEICKNWRFRRLFVAHYLLKNRQAFKDK